MFGGIHDSRRTPLEWTLIKTFNPSIDFGEEDPVGDGDITFSATRVDVDNIDSFEPAWAYYDGGVDYFNGSFRVDFDFRIGSGTTSGLDPIVVGFANQLGVKNTLHVDSGTRDDCWIVSYSVQNNRTTFLERYGTGAGDEQSKNQTGLAEDTVYYCSIWRDQEDVNNPPSGWLIFALYSSPERISANLVDWAWLALNETQDWRYLVTFATEGGLPPAGQYYAWTENWKYYTGACPCAYPSEE